MQIRTRLTLQFLLLGAIVMIIASTAIYISSSEFRRDDFYNRLRDKARSTANLVFDPEGVDAKRVLELEGNNPLFLQNEKIIILNFKNDTVYNSDENSDIIIRNDVLEKVRLGNEVTYRQDQYNVLSGLYFNNYQRYVVIAAAADTDGAAYLGKLRMILAMVSVVSLLLLTVAGWFWAGRALRPITAVIKRVDEISITSLNLRVPEGNGTDEIGRLAKTFNRVLERLEKSFAMQKDFIANASHELRTPLTSINGQLEVMMMKDRTTAEYKSALQSVLDDIRSLIDLSNRLLLIARTSAEGPMNFNNDVRIDEVLWQVQEEMVRFGKDYHISIDLDDSLTESEQMTVTGDASLLKVAVSNLIDNACKYSPDHTVIVTLEPKEKWIQLCFTDNGIGIPEEDQEKIFEPFYRGTNAHSAQGSGIGLPLVNQIVRNHNGILKLSSAVGKGTTVTILLPVTT